jgi:hypothetical protein
LRQGLILVFLVNETFKTKSQFNGHEYANADEMPVSVRAAYDRVIGETPCFIPEPDWPQN